MSDSRFFWSLFAQFGLFFYLCGATVEWSFHPGEWHILTRLFVVSADVFLSAICLVHRTYKRLYPDPVQTTEEGK